MIPVLCRWPSFLANVYMAHTFAFVLYSVCVNSSLCGRANCPAVLNRILMCPLKLLLHICCGWPCKQVQTHGLVLQQPRGLGVGCIPSSLIILNDFIFFSFLLGANASMIRIWGSASVFRPRVCRCRGRVQGHQGHFELPWISPLIWCPPPWCPNLRWLR